MATEAKGEILTNRHVTMMAAEISVPNMRILAQKYMGLEKEVIDELEAENIEDKETFKRAVIKRWANMNSDEQVERLALLLYDSAKRNLVDPTKVWDILGVSEDLGLADMAEKLRLHKAKTTRIEMAPWAKAYTVDVKDVYTDLTLEKLENKPTGPEGKTVKDYKELFADKNEDKEENSEKKPGKKVLLKADPGMGKTTFGKHLAYDWAKGVLTAFSIVFFVTLKLVRPGDAIENIIMQQTPALAGLGVKQEQIRKILDKFGNRCLIIFDGYDEFKAKNEDVMKIIEGRKLFRCNIVLTSRPHNVENVEEFFSAVVVIQGFSEKHTSQYISKVLMGQDKVQAVLKFNKNNFMTDRKQYTCPMLILFICILVNHDELDLARKNVALGEIYWRLLRSIYRKYCEKAGVQFSHRHFVDVVTRVSFLAYRMFGLEQTCFQRSDIPEVAGEDIFEYGFLIGYEDYKLLGHETADIAVGFPHDTIGEFFAAFCEMYRLSESHWVESFFLQHMSLLHFCLWLVTDLQMEVGFDKKATLASFEKDLLREYNTTTLDLNTLVKTRLDVYRETKDDVILNFMKSLLSKCDKVKHLVLSVASPVMWILECLGSTLDQLSTVWITDKYYNYDDAVRDSVRFRFLSSGITFVVDVEAEHSNDGESYAQLKAMATELSGHATVNLVIMTKRIKQRIDLPEVLLPRFKKVCIGVQGDDCGRLLVFASFENPSPLNLTHLSFVRCNVHPNSFNLLSLAGQKGQLACLSHLSFVDCEVKGRLEILFECVWPALTHLSFRQTLLNENDVRHLQEALTGSSGSRLLPRLESLVWCFGDELDDRYGQERNRVMAPVDNLQLMSIWRRPLDIVLPEIIKVPLERVTSLWLEDLNKEEYKKIIATLNTRRPSRLKTLGISLWKHARLHKNAAVFVKNVAKQGQNWTIAWTTLDPYDLDILPVVNISTLTRLTLHRFICTIQHLYTVTKSPVLTRLTKLDISHSSGVTGSLSILLCHKFPYLSHLTLNDCGLNFQDLGSLASSEHKGRLPLLRHLDISANHKVVGKLGSLFEFGCKWNSLLSLNVEGTSSKCFQYLGQKVASGCLSSLEKLSFSMNEKTLNYKGGQWKRLTDLKISSKVCEVHTILSVAKQLVEQGAFPAISILTLSPGKGDSEEDDEKAKDLDSSSVRLAQALHINPLGTYIYDVLDQIGLRTQAFLGRFAAKIHAASSPESSYSEILHEMAAIEASSFADALNENVAQNQREQIQEAYELDLIATARHKVTNRRSDSDKRTNYFEAMENKRALMARNISLFTYSKEFVSGW